MVETALPGVLDDGTRRYPVGARQGVGQGEFPRKHGEVLGEGTAIHAGTVPIVHNLVRDGVGAGQDPAAEGSGSRLEDGNGGCRAVRCHDVDHQGASIVVDGKDQLEGAMDKFRCLVQGNEGGGEAARTGTSGPVRLHSMAVVALFAWRFVCRGMERPCPGGVPALERGSGGAGRRCRSRYPPDWSRRS